MLDLELVSEVFCWQEWELMRLELLIMKIIATLSISWIARSRISHGAVATELANRFAVTVVKMYLYL